MKRFALFVGQLEEGFAKLLHPNRLVLAGRQPLLRHFRGRLVPAIIRAAVTEPIDMRVVNDRQQPCADVSTCPERRLPFIGFHQCIMHEVLSLIRITRQ